MKLTKDKSITNARNDENAKENKNFVLSNFRVFVINHFLFSASGGSGLRLKG